MRVARVLGHRSALTRLLPAATRSSVVSPRWSRLFATTNVCSTLHRVLTSTIDRAGDTTMTPSTSLRLVLAQNPSVLLHTRLTPAGPAVQSGDVHD